MFSYLCHVVDINSHPMNECEVCSASAKVIAVYNHVTVHERLLLCMRHFLDIFTPSDVVCSRCRRPVFWREGDEDEEEVTHFRVCMSPPPLVKRRFSESFVICTSLPYLLELLVNVRLYLTFLTQIMYY